MGICQSKTADQVKTRPINHPELIPSGEKDFFNVSINDDIIQVKDENIVKEKNNNQKINIILITTSQIKIKILIDTNKKMKDLIKCYFEIIKKPDLYGDESIRFIINANFIPQNSEDLIKNYVKKDNEVILIDDLEDKIYPSFFN